MVDVGLEVVPMTAADWPHVRRVYAAGLATGHATFESEPPTWPAFHQSKMLAHRLVAVDVQRVVRGWAAVVPVSDRCVYAGVVEHSVYVDPALQGRGVGRLLLDELVSSTEEAGIWTVQSGIFPENLASLVLHERAGFRVIGVRRRVGRMAHGPLVEQWRDVLQVERRSERVGI